MLKIKTALYSDIGNTREKNEDNLYWDGHFRRSFELQSTLKRSYISDKQFQILSITDGMGGLAKGELASRMALSLMPELEEQMRHANPDQDTLYLDGYLRDRAQAIAERNKNFKNENEMMGTTISIVSFRPHAANLVNMGDSSVFQFRPTSGLRQMSRDDSHAARLRSLGYLTKAEVKQHPLRNALNNFLGNEYDEEKFNYFLVKDIRLQKSDIFMLSSDGVSAFVSRNAIETILASEVDLEDKVDDLVNLAVQNGSDDNITLILCEILDCDSREEKQPLATASEAENLEHLDDALHSYPKDLHSPNASTYDETTVYTPLKKPVQGLSVMPHNQKAQDSNSVVTPLTDANESNATNGTSNHMISSQKLSMDEEQYYQKAREDAMRRQREKQNRKQAQTVLAKENQPIESGQYSSSPKVELSADEKARIYDLRYRDTGKAPSVHEVHSSQNIEKPRKESAFSKFLSWLIFFILFILIGFLVSWVLLKMI